MMNYNESGMNFSSLFDSDKFQSFYIEKSALYEKLKPYKVKVVEFLSVKDNTQFYFIECKSSFPDVNKFGNKVDLEVDCQKLYDKLHHTIDLIVARQIGIKKHLQHKFPKELGCSDVLEANLVEFSKFFFLIMKGEHFTPDACRGILFALNKKLISLRKIWDIEIKVINEKKARQLKFIK